MKPNWRVEVRDESKRSYESYTMYSEEAAWLKAGEMSKIHGRPAHVYRYLGHVHYALIEERVEDMPEAEGTP